MLRILLISRDVDPDTSHIGQVVNIKLASPLRHHIAGAESHLIMLQCQFNRQQGDDVSTKLIEFPEFIRKPANQLEELQAIATTIGH